MGYSGFRAMLRDRKNRESLYCTAEYWDSKADEYHGSAVSMWHNNHLNLLYHREILDVLSRLLPDVTGSRILDVGCGTGRISRHLANMSAEVQGIDFSMKAIAIAASASPGGNPGYRVLSVFDITDELTYDYVVSWGTITIACKNRIELLDVLTRLHRSLKPQGKMLLMEPIHKGFLHRVLNINVKDFCKIMTEAKFEIKYITHLHFWPMRLLLAYINWPRFITVSGYYAGEWILRLIRHKAFGDYVAIFATPKRK
jgi:2-polyprenyl-3-methyl-5-hydroxy-6-metoxy-1,4-benzoquinol methylase